MVIDRANFLLSLAVALAAVASTRGTAVRVGTDLFYLNTDQSAADDPNAVLSPTGGPKPPVFVRRDIQSVQLMANGSNPAATLALSQALYDAFYGDDDQPRNQWLIDAKTLVSGQVVDGPEGQWYVQSVSLAQPPGVTGKDPTNKRTYVSFNFNVTFSKET